MPTDSVPEPAPAALLLCYITDRSQFPGATVDQEQRLLEKIAECAAADVDLIQLREKDLSARELEKLAQKAIAAIPPGSSSQLLLNSRTDVALASGAHGVHLPAHDLAASDARAIMVQAGRTDPVIGVSTHSAAEVAQAESHGADFAVFGPVFAKNGQLNPRGLEQLRQACHRPRIDGTPMPVLAIGGITLENAGECFAAGAAGVAAIRLFQQNDAALVAAQLRSLFRQ
ncbi:MAG TPA: thiamine phosphate synthase [Candidatus Angelobacter sp.]